MPVLKAAGVGGSILVILALIITFLKQIIAFIGLLVGFISFLTFAIKILLIVAFVAVLLGVGIMVLRAMSDRRKAKE